MSSLNCLDFDRVGCNKSMGMSGMTWIGNSDLWYLDCKNRIGVFADSRSKGQDDRERGQWAIRTGCFKKCLVGIFHTWAEKEILKLHLQNGGKAIWMMGTSFPKNFSKVCGKAIYEGRLLVISCFWHQEWSFPTFRYCCQMVAMCASSLMFWSLDHFRYTEVIYNLAVARGADVKLYTASSRWKS